MEGTRFLWAFWWLIFPIMGFAMGAYRSWLNYRRQRDVMEVLRAYANSGKEPPADLLVSLNSLTAKAAEADGRKDRSGRYGAWFAGVVLIGIAAPFAVLANVGPFRGEDGFIFVAVFLGMFGAALVIADLIARRLFQPAPGAADDGR